MIEQAHETARLTAYAAHLEAETQALRTLNDAMAMVCERLLSGRQTDSVSESERAE
jgi:hypothetical protein